MFFKHCRRIFNTVECTRRFHVSSRLNIDPKTVEEVRIPVPWGYIAGKRWGDRESQPIIALHGKLDNSSTFDRLIPLLDVPSVLCLDITGQGLSTHIPKTFPYIFIDYIFHLRYILKNLLQFEKNLFFMGHSFGSYLLFNYAGIFPNDVSKMVNIDCARFAVTSDTDYFVKETKDNIISFLNYKEDTSSGSKFSFEESLEHMKEVRESLHMPISDECCRLLATRGISNIGNGKSYYSHDPRLKLSSLGRNTASYSLDLASKITCEVLNIHGAQSDILAFFKSDIDDHTEIMSKNCKSFVNLVVDGGHHLHLETPEIVAPHINKFFKC